MKLVWKGHRDQIWANLGEHAIDICERCCIRFGSSLRSASWVSTDDGDKICVRTTAEYADMLSTPATRPDDCNSNSTLVFAEARLGHLGRVLRHDHLAGFAAEELFECIPELRNRIRMGNDCSKLGAMSFQQIKISCKF